MNRRKRCHRLLAGLLGVALLFSKAEALQQDNARLLQRHAELREQLANNQFQRPNSVNTLKINIGRKFEQPLADAYPFNFVYEVRANQPDFLQVQLTAVDGPMGTSNYDIELQIVAMDEQRSFLHMSYAYSYGLASQAAMQGYLTTIGRDKPGFSIIGYGSDGQPLYQDGMRGVIERNTMRYYLALEAYLGGLSGTPAERQEQRLNDWHSAVERYPLQLHELERSEYLAMKHAELRRQQKPLH